MLNSFAPRRAEYAPRRGRLKPTESEANQVEIRRAILSLSAIALFAPAIAAADDAVPCPHEPPQTQYTPASSYTPAGTPTGEAQDVDWRWGDRDDERWDRDWDHDGDRDGRWGHHRRGRWELQTFNRWVEGRYDQVWVPEQCQNIPNRWRPFAPRVVCQPAHYESRWIPGRYEQVQQWVWVPRR